MLSIYRTWLASKLRADDGAVALEYGVLVVGIVVLLAIGALVFGGELQGFFSDLFPTVVNPPA